MIERFSGTASLRIIIYLSQILTQNALISFSLVNVMYQNEIAEISIARQSNFWL